MALTIDQFLSHLNTSGLMAAEDATSLIAALPERQQPKDGEALARELVRQQKLTKFQAEQVYAGKGNSLTLGNYIILDKLGQGGMGMVLKAAHKRMKRLVALKVMSPAAVKSADALKRFHREVEAAAKLTHPNIVAAHDADEAKGTHFLVMEYVDGSDLSALVKKHGPLPVEQAIRCIIQAARGLEFAHEQGVIHRDIKPANLLIDAKGTVKILDMGLARIEGAIGGSAEKSELTQSGTIMGTVDYMSPEQAMDTKHADARSDIYSLGCTLYYLLTGQVLFGGDTMMKKLMAHQNAPIPSLEGLRVEGRGLRDGQTLAGSTINPQLSTLNQVFHKMVAKRPEDRPQSMTEVIAELERCLSGGSATVTFTSPSSAGSGDALQQFLKEMSGDTPASATSGSPVSKMAKPTSQTAVAEGSGVAETMISSAGEARTDPRTEQSLTIEQSKRLRLSKAGTSIGKKSRPAILVSVAVAVVVLLAIAFAVRGRTGTLHLEITDDLTEVTIGNTGRIVKGATEQDLHLPLGENVLHVEREDLAFDTDPIEVKKGHNVPIKVERVGRRIQAMQGKKLLGHKEPPSSTPPRSSEASSKTSVAIQRRAGKYEVVAPDYRAKVNSDGLLEKLEVAGTTLIEKTDFGGGEHFGRIGLGGFVTAKQADATLDFQQARDYRLNYEFDANGFTVRAQVSEAAARRDAVDAKAYFIFYDVLFTNEATMVRRVDGAGEFPLPSNVAESTSRFAVAFKNGIELEVSSPPTEANFNSYRWSHGHLTLDTDNIFRFDIRKSSATPASKPALAVAPFDPQQARAHQEAWAKHLGTTVETTNSVGAKMILIPPGEFLMGSTDEQAADALKAAEELQVDRGIIDQIQKSERPQHQVTITKPFLISATEVTIGQFKKFSATGYQTPAEKANKDGQARTYLNPVEMATDDLPAAVVTWSDAAAFCHWLSVQANLDPCYRWGGDFWFESPDKNGYRLPSEAEWEYACRAGTTTQYSFGDDSSDLRKYGWYDQNIGGRVRPAGAKRPNAFGLFDMHGSLWEWCDDIYDAEWYEESPPHDPRGPVNGESRVQRGGSWQKSVSACRSAYRGGSIHYYAHDSVGFRIVRVLDAQLTASAPP